MSRFVVIRESSEQDERVTEDSPVPTEDERHQELMRHPSARPLRISVLAQIVTVGFETTLASRRADRVLMDDSCRLCLAEAKMEGDPDTRRVIAQVMDDTTEPWDMTLEQLEQAVLRG